MDKVILDEQRQTYQNKLLLKIKTDYFMRQDPIITRGGTFPSVSNRTSVR